MDNLPNIAAHLRRRDSRFLLNTYLELGGGILLSFLAPLAIALFVRTLCWFWKAHHCPWAWSFIGGAIVTLPLLFRLELLAQGGLLRELADRFNAATFPKDEPPSFKHVGAVGTALAQTRTPVTGSVEFFLIGPRMVVSALRQLRMRALSKDADPQRVLRIAEALYTLEVGAATEKMLDPNEPPQQLCKVLAYLLFFDWIGIANDGSKVWLLTESRREWEREVR
jgi:hypothetical protein